MTNVKIGESLLGIAENDNALESWEFYYVRDKHDEIRKNENTKLSLKLLSQSLDDHLGNISNDILANEDW